MVQTHIALYKQLIMIKIRKTEPDDLDRVMQIYDIARSYMRRRGNLTQWSGGYPSRQLVSDDIEQRTGYVGVDETGKIIMAFAFIIGADPTYTRIEEGEWLDNEPYGTIHRLASDGSHHGILKCCVDFCFSQIDNLRLDTHADNATMQHAATLLGFTRCGIIYCIDGSPRIAYQKRIGNNRR